MLGSNHVLNIFMDIESIQSAKAEFTQKLNDLEASLQSLDPSNIDLYLTRSTQVEDLILGVKAAIEALNSFEIEAIQQTQIDSETQRIEAEKQHKQSLESEIEQQIKALI
jgi:hypothetical protein